MCGQGLMFPGSTYLLVREYSDFLLTKAYHKKCENTSVHKELMEILISDLKRALWGKPMGMGKHARPCSPLHLRTRSDDASTRLLAFGLG